MKLVIGDTSGSASFDTLTEDLDTVFSLFTEVLRQPAFAADQFAIAKKTGRREELPVAMTILKILPVVNLIS